MAVFIRVSGDGFIKHRKKDRLEFCDEIFELKEHLNEKFMTEGIRGTAVRVEFEDRGVKAQIWAHHDIEYIRSMCIKPLWYRIFVDPDIRRGFLCAMAFAVLVTSINSTLAAFAAAYFLLPQIGMGIFLLIDLVGGAIADLIDSFKPAKEPIPNS